MSPAPDRASRSPLLLAAAAVLVVGVVAVVLLVGVPRPPSLPALADEPEPAPSAAVALAGQGEGEPCVVVARADGTVDRLDCGLQGDLVGWPAAGLALRTFDDGQVRLLDTETGEVTGRLGRAAAGRATADRRAVWTTHEDGRLTVRRSDDDAVVWEVAAPARYDVRTATASPDGDWLAMVDTADRLLLAPADGGPVRVWAEDVDGWAGPVWEGEGVSDPAAPVEPREPGGG